MKLTLALTLKQSSCPKFLTAKITDVLLTNYNAKCIGDLFMELVLA